jgi:capsular polysaccharide biosynthesis protein
MIVPTDYEGTSCTRITRNDDIQRTNPNFRRNQSIKYALLAAAAAGVIAAVLVIILDAQDKRLRDHEVITRKLKVPVLGIIPTIDEMNQAADTKKQNRGDN